VQPRLESRSAWPKTGLPKYWLDSAPVFLPPAAVATRRPDLLCMQLEGYLFVRCLLCCFLAIASKSDAAWNRTKKPWPRQRMETTSNCGLSRIAQVGKERRPLHLSSFLEGFLGTRSCLFRDQASREDKIRLQYLRSEIAAREQEHLNHFLMSPSGRDSNHQAICN